MGKLSKILSSFLYLTCIILFLSYAGLVYVNNSNDTIEPENISRSVVAQDSQLNKLKESNKTEIMPLGCKFPKAYLFGKRIQQAVKDKDLTSIFNMVEGELALGPRKKDALEKSFDEVFTDEWRENILSTEPMCDPQGVYGFHLGNGNLWYDTDDIDDLTYTGSNWIIFTIHGTILKDSSKPVKPSWVIEKKLLMANCFEIMSASGDNYEEYHKRYGGDSKLGDFYQNIGKYIGTQIPLDPINASWGDIIYLAQDLNECTTPYAGTEKTISLNNNSEKRTIEIGEEIVREKYCSPDSSCEAGFYYYDSYSILKNLPKEACGLLAPQLKNDCVDVRLVERPPQFRGDVPSGNIYGIYKESTKNELYVVPLKNFGTVNDALNFTDTLISTINSNDSTDNSKVTDTGTVIESKESSKTTHHQKMTNTIKEGISFYLKGNYEIAFKVFSDFAKHGDSEGQYFLGLMYKNGFGVKKNSQKAKNLFRLSLKQGNKKAKKILESPTILLTQDSQEALGEGQEVKKEYWKNGKLKIENHWKDGKQEGLETGWYESGEKSSETHFKNGRKDGLETKWYESGEKKSESDFKNGKQDGLETEWFENGRKISDCKNYNGESVAENRIIHPKVNKHFNLIFTPDPKKSSHTNVLLESLSSNKKSLLANIKVLTPMELCGSLGCPAGLGENKAEFSNDDSIVAFSVEGTETIYVFETQSGEKIMSANYSTFALSPDGKRLVGGGYSWKTGWQLSMYRLDIKTKEALSGYDWDVSDEFGNENPDNKPIGDKEKWYDGTKFKKFNFTKNGENLILKNPARMGVNNVYNFKTKRFTRSCAGSDHEANNITK